MQGSQQAQLTEAMQQNNNIQKNLENAKKVQNTSNEKSNANGVNHNGSNSSSFYGQNKKKKDQNQNNDEYENRAGSSNSPYLGNIIDITS